MAVRTDTRNRLQRHRIWDTIYRRIMLTVRPHMNQGTIQSSIQTSLDCTVSAMNAKLSPIFAGSV